MDVSHTDQSVAGQNRGRGGSRAKSTKQLEAEQLNKEEDERRLRRRTGNGRVRARTD